MQPHLLRLLAFVAGGLLIVIPSPRAAHAVSSGSLPPFHVPPQLNGFSQSTAVLPPGGTAEVGILATDPQGFPLTFSWEANAGTLGTPVDTGTSSLQTWTAPQCLAEDATPVAVTVTSNYGQSISASFGFSVAQDLSVNRQPPFADSGFELLENATAMLPQELWLTPPEAPRSSERIVFPRDQQLSVTFIAKESEATHAFGYVYYDDLVARGYVNAQGDLVDANGNGIADLHEDLYNLAPPSGAQARPYIGVSPRCSRTFVSRGFIYRQPDLALNSTCGSAFTTSHDVTDARPGRTSSAYNITADIVGTVPPTPSANAGTGFSDNGLFTRIPNLLEPAHAANNFMGLGALVFLSTEDDSNLTTYRAMGLVPDADDFEDGIPDYDVSRYDTRGNVRPYNPDPGISRHDRTVDLGIIQGGREMVFFLVTAFDAAHNLDDGTVFPCLSRDADLKCTLHLRTPLSVFFSKTKWNLDQDPVGRLPTAQRNIGCAFSDQCDPDHAQSSSKACPVVPNGQKLCGWVDSNVLQRIAAPYYGGLVLPKEGATVPASVNLRMPHVLMTAPTTVPGQWLMGFEDLNGGGDRDFNDAVFLFQGQAPMAARSKVLNPPDASCAVSRVRFTKTDTVPAGCASEPAPRYEVATDCASNPTPTWHPLPLQRGPDSVTLDVSGTPGNQLCWKVTHPGSPPACLPAAVQVNVGYELTPVAP
ncbi:MULTISPECIES: DUF4114 domain-containing protein [unclassified Corallococcus]|uniref:DUF4114 domain-containing protein n=1 Tax=unclassified Corallococcus TaxID=2685029 RepID=UPI001A8CB869|nr:MULTISPECIES: DUF4114 domain-containing protein [unclassified Corallococcus]MBN9688466.1 DUF4114 domain-containing protein [Corallococcus sp. NCSPR001]WAS87733.1 DUF4114 domain-containing protein [Corallococcus sp. NCRR]